MQEPVQNHGEPLQRGFLLGEWMVRPLAGVLQRNGHELHLEPKVMDVLVCLARHQGDVVTREVLLTEVWGKVIVTDDAITRCISDLRTLLGDTGRERSYIRTIPRRGYSLMIPVLPLTNGDAAVIPAMGLPNRDIASPVPAATATATGRRGARPAFYLSAVALSVLIIVLFNDTEPAVPADPAVADAAMAPAARLGKGQVRQAPSKINSVAVLPFVNLGGDGVQENFSDGLSEDIRNSLLTATGLRVAARTSSEVFRNRAMDVRDIGAQLNVEALLEGTVRITGKRLRITTQLTHARDGYAVWAASFERDLADRLQMQTEVAEEIVRQLGPTLGEPSGMPKAATANVEARDYYLLGRHHWHLRTADGVNQSVAYFRQAIALDPDYALAYSGLADALLFQSLYGERTLEEVEQQAREAIDKALQLDPDLAEAHASRGILLKTLGDMEGALVANQRAVDLKPQYSMGQMWLALAWQDKHDMNRAYKHMAEALKVDPLHPLVQANYSDVLMRQGRYEEAFEALDRFTRMNPSEMLLKAQVSGRLSLGRYDEVLGYAVGRTFTDEFKPYASAPVIEALIQLQRFAEAERIINDNAEAMDEWLRAWLESRLAIARRDVAGIERVAADLVSTQAVARRDEMGRRCGDGWSAYLRGTAAFLDADLQAADARFEEFERHRVVDGCHEFEPEMEISAWLYRATIGGRMQPARGQEFAGRARQRLDELRQLGWNTPELASLEALADYLLADAEGSRKVVQNMSNHHWQPLGYMHSTPLFDDFLASDQFAVDGARLAQGFAEVRSRSGEISLAKLGL